jgi:tetratricopeptide (TPR) repeat protein
VSRARIAFGALLALITGMGAAPAAAVEPPALPHPQLEALDPAVREQLGELRRQVDSLLAEAPDSPEALAALALLAETYLAYDFVQAAEAALEMTLDQGFQPFRSAYLLGYARERLGSFAEAAVALRRAIGERPRDAPALVRLGKVLLAGIAPEEAPPLFEQALAADPDCVAARYGLGEAARIEGDDAAAAAHYRAALERRPELTQARYALALALRRQGRVEGAAAEMARVDLERVRLSGDSWEGCADPLLADVAGLATGASAYVLRGAIAYFQGDLDREISEYSRAVEANPEDHIARKSLAAAHFRKGDSAEALRHYRETVRLEPADATYRYDLGQIYHYRGGLDEAEAQYREAVRLNPNFEEPRLRLAEMALARRAPEAAVEEARGALAVNPASVVARTLLAQALLLAGRQQEAAEELGRLLDEAPPQDPRQRLELASLTLLMGDAERAESHLRAVAEQRNATAEIRALARFRLGLIQLGRGLHEAAIATIREALELDPDLPEGREALAAAQEALAAETD